jgi:predicted TIM-barrel fold metal-dependent hydrolase
MPSVSALAFLFGPDASPFETDRLAENIAPIRALAIPEEEKALTLGGNAARLLELA